MNRETIEINPDLMKVSEREKILEWLKEEKIPTYKEGTTIEKAEKMIREMIALIEMEKQELAGTRV